MIIAGILLRVLKVWQIVKVTRLPVPVDADRPVLVIVEDVKNEKTK